MECEIYFSLITEKHAKCASDLVKVLEGSGNEVPDELRRLKPHQRKMRGGYNHRGRGGKGGYNNR